MTIFEEYISQGIANNTYDYEDSSHTDGWVDEASESTYGHSGHCDVHSEYVDVND